MKKWRLVCYDIREPRRLRRVAKLLEGHGARVQYSVFRIYTTAREFEKLKWRLERETEPEDSLLYISLCPGCAAGVHTPEDEHPWPDRLSPSRLV
jgi:CRISPR-associated protein Cas2